MAQVHHFFSGQKMTAVSAIYVDGHWEISYRNKQVRILPELPDFKDFMRVLSRWVLSLDKQYPLKFSSEGTDTSLVVRNQLSQFLAPHVIVAAHEADILWEKGQHNPGLLLDATRALTFLSLQRMDRLEIGDALPAKALALLAITKTLTREKCGSDEALLSYSMGYSAYAVSVASSPPLRDPARLYVTDDDHGLKEIAKARDGSPESRYLYLLRLADKQDVKSFIEWTRAYFRNTLLSLPLFKAGLDMDTFSLTPRLSMLLPPLVVMTMAQDAGATSAAYGEANNGKNKFRPAVSGGHGRHVQVLSGATLGAHRQLLSWPEERRQELQRPFPGAADILFVL